MGTVRETRKNEHKDTKKKKEKVHEHLKTNKKKCT